MKVIIFLEQKFGNLKKINNSLLLLQYFFWYLKGNTLSRPFANNLLVIKWIKASVLHSSFASKEWINRVYNFNTLFNNIYRFSTPLVAYFILTQKNTYKTSHCPHSTFLLSCWNVVKCVTVSGDFRNVEKNSVHSLRKSFLLFFIWILLVVDSLLYQCFETKNFSADCFSREKHKLYLSQAVFSSLCPHCHWLEGIGDFESF